MKVQSKVQPERSMNGNGILITPAREEAVAEARAAINDILASPAENDTKRAALSTLQHLCAVSSVSIMNNTIHVDAKDRA